MKYFVIVSLVFATFLGHAQQKGANSKAASGPGPNFSGKVLESINTAGYTYVLLDTGKQQVWAAGVEFPVKKGDKVAIGGGMEMRDYHSKTLNRDFDLVYFASEVEVNGKSTKAGADNLPAGHPPIGGLPQGHPTPGAAAGLPQGHPPLTGGTTAAAPGAPKKVDVSSVKKATGGKTVREVHAEKAQLKGKPIVIRGKVVKYNAGILGKNWLHIQDGTGDPANPSLVITTDTEVKVGDTVLVNGKVSTDRDFGGGYRYAVIVENAKVTRE